MVDVLFIVPFAIGIFVDEGDDVSNFHYLSAVGDGEANNGAVGEPERDSLGRVKLTELNRRSPRSSVSGALAQQISTMALFHLVFSFIFFFKLSVRHRVSVVMALPCHILFPSLSGVKV